MIVMQNDEAWERAWNAGWDAAFHGGNRNPYTETRLRYAWEKGWTKGVQYLVKRGQQPEPVA